MLPSDHQRKFIDKLAAEAALACCQKEAAAAKLQDAKLQREADHNEETAKLREQEREMTIPGEAASSRGWVFLGLTASASSRCR